MEVTTHITVISQTIILHKRTILLNKFMRLYSPRFFYWINSFIDWVIAKYLESFYVIPAYWSSKIFVSTH